MNELPLPAELAEKYPRQPIENLFDWHKRLWTIQFRRSVVQVQDQNVKDALWALRELAR